MGDGRAVLERRANAAPPVLLIMAENLDDAFDEGESQLLEELGRMSGAPRAPPRRAAPGRAGGRRGSQPYALRAREIPPCLGAVAPVAAPRASSWRL